VWQGAAVNRFEYLSVLVSIVIGLGICEIASSWGRILRSRSRVRFYWLQAFWSVFTILLMIQFWWGFWEFRLVEHWSFAGLLAVVAEAFVLVLAGMILLPNVEPGAPLDLRAHYFEHCRLYFVLGSLLIAQLAVVDRLVGEQPLFHAENAFRLPGVLVAAVAAAYPREKLHAGLALVASVLLLGFVTFSFSR
jgi:hypothetical protein